MALVLVSLLAPAEARSDTVRYWEQLDESERQLLGVWDVVMRQDDGAELTFQLTVEDVFVRADRPVPPPDIARGRIARARNPVNATFELRDGALSGSLRSPLTKNPAFFETQREGSEAWRGVWVAMDREGLTDDQLRVLVGLSTGEFLDRQRAGEPLPTGAVGGRITWTKAPTELTAITVLRTSKPWGERKAATVGERSLSFSADLEQLRENWARSSGSAITAFRLAIEGQNLPSIRAVTNYLDPNAQRSGRQSFYVHSDDENLSLDLYTKSDSYTGDSNVFLDVNVYEGLTAGTRTITIGGVDVELEIAWRGLSAPPDIVLEAPPHAPTEPSTTSEIRVYAVGIDRPELAPDLTFYRPYFVEVEFSEPQEEASVEVTLDVGAGTRKALARVVPDSDRRLYRTIPFLLFPQGGTPPAEVIAPVDAPR